MRPSFQSVGGAIGLYEISGFSSSNDSIKIPLGDLDTVATWAIVRAEISGDATATYTSATANPPFTNPGGTWETFNGGGVYYGNACTLNISLLYASGNITWCNIPGNPAQAEKWALVKGAGSLFWNARRIAKTNCGPQSVPCYDVAGGFQVEIEIPPVEFTVTASHKAITSNTLVTFSATVTPGTLGGITVPFRVKSNGWRWVPDSGTASVPCGNPLPDTNPETCQFTVTTSGYMYVDAEVQGENVTMAVYVSKVPCLTGDSLLDDRRLRKSLRTAMDSSYPNAPPFDRRERGGKRLLMPDGTVQDTLFPIGANDTPCDFYPPNLGEVSGIPIFGWHIHPFRPNDPNDPLPYNPNATPRSNCPRLATEPPLPYPQVRTAGSGPSWPYDYKSNWTEIVVDKDSVYIVPPGQVQNNYKSVPRSGCDPLNP